MAVPAQTFLSYAAVGNREDLSNVIYNVDPTDKPFMTRSGATDATNVLHEWQKDVLKDPDVNNARLEGDDATTTATTPTTRPNNVCQISDQVPRVSGTQQAIVSAGRRDELAYQIYKDTLNLGNDMETILVAETARVDGNDTTARRLGALEAWYESNVNRGATGSSGGGGTTAPTDGTQRDFTENLLKDVIQKCWTNGGNPDWIMLGGAQKQVMSTFTGNATRMKTAEDGRLVATIDIYQSDFGELEIVPSRRSRARTVHVLQADMWAVAYLRTPRISNLAKTGDSERRQVLAEYTLVARNEKASGVVADVN